MNGGREWGEWGEWGRKWGEGTWRGNGVREWGERMGAGKGVRKRDEWGEGMV